MPIRFVQDNRNSHMQPTAEQFTEQAWAAIVAAQQLAQASRHQQLETEHLLQALLRTGWPGQPHPQKKLESHLHAPAEASVDRSPATQQPSPAAPHLNRCIWASSLNTTCSIVPSSLGTRLSATAYISVEHLLLSPCR